MKITYYGEECLYCDFENEITEHNSLLIIQFSEIIKHNILNVTINCGLTAILVLFDLSSSDPDCLIKQIQKLYTDNKLLLSDREKVIKRVPICYDPEFGLDQQRISEFTGLSVDELIQHHQQTEFFVYCYGGWPAAPRLGQTKVIAPGKLPIPRASSQPGLIGWCGQLNNWNPNRGIGGGWNLIGRSPLRILNDKKEQPFFFSPGDYIKFYPITKDEFFNFNQDCY